MALSVPQTGFSSMMRQGTKVHDAHGKLMA